MFSNERLHHELAASVREGRWQIPPADAPRPQLLPIYSPLTLAAGDHPEGVAVDPTGNVFVGNRRFSEGLRQAEIVKLPRGGGTEVFARLPDTVDPAGNGLLGLVTDPEGCVYAALDSRSPESRGVWRITPDGSRLERIPGSGNMVFPNALIFDAMGRLYATDSADGAIWRFPLSNPALPAPWIRHELLAPFEFDPFGLPLPTGGFLPVGLPGANGIAFYPPNELYAANTEKGLLVQITIQPDGSAGPARIAAGEPVPSDSENWLPDPRIWTMDGIAVDSEGHLFGVVPGSAVLSALTGRQLSPLIRINPATKEIIPCPVDAGMFHVPLSLAFGRAPDDRQNLYVTNAALFAELFPGRGPGLVRVSTSCSGWNVVSP